MDLRLLGYVLAVAEAGTIVAAAERLHITQPTLGRQLRDLERRLGADLFERRGRRMVPTPAGEVLLARARTMLEQARLAEEEFRRAARGLRGRLTVTFAGSGINGPLGATLATMRTTYPEIELRLVESFNDNEMSELVLAGVADVAVQRLPVRDPRLETREWWTEPLSVFLPEGHPLAAETRPLPPNRLAEVPLVLWPREVSPQSYDEILALFHRVGVVPEIAAEGRTVQTLLALSAAGIGAAVLADSYRVLRREGVVPRVLAGTTTTNSLVWRADPPNPMLDRFLGLAGE